MDPAMKQQAELNEGLIEAAREGNLTRVQVLVREGADLESKNEIGENALHLSARGNHHEVVAWLLDQHMDMEAPDLQYGSTPLHKAAMNGHREAAAILIDRGASITRRNIDGETPITIAEREEQSEMAAYLRSKLPNP